MVRTCHKKAWLLHSVNKKRMFVTQFVIKN